MDTADIINYLINNKIYKIFNMASKIAKGKTKLRKTARRKRVLPPKTADYYRQKAMMMDFKAGKPLQYPQMPPIRTPQQMGWMPPSRAVQRMPRSQSSYAPQSYRRY